MNLPHLNYLRSFEASARHLSFTAAAAELNLSQAAVSGHIRALEQYVGGPLFLRHARSLDLTTLGTAYLPSIQQALSMIEFGTDSIVKRQDGRKVVISCPVTLAEGWLAEVIAAYAQHDPRVSFTIHARVWMDEPPEIADLIIGSAHVDSIPPQNAIMWHDQVALCCAPHYKINAKPLRSISQLADVRRVQVLSHMDYWQIVMESLGEPEFESAHEPTYSSSFSTALALTKEGHGVSIIPLCYAQKFLNDGSLIALFDQTFSIPYAMTISQPDARAAASVAKTFAYIMDAAKTVPQALAANGHHDSRTVHP